MLKRCCSIQCSISRREPKPPRDKTFCTRSGEISTGVDDDKFAADFFRDSGESGVDLILLALADTRATYDHAMTQDHWAAALDVSRALLEAWYEKAEEIIRPPQLINGGDLIKEFKQKPGPEIGKLLEAVRETQAAGNLSTRAEALAFVQGWLAKAREK